MANNSQDTKESRSGVNTLGVRILTAGQSVRTIIALFSPDRETEPTDRLEKQQLLVHTTRSLSPAMFFSNRDRSIEQLSNFILLYDFSNLDRVSERGVNYAYFPPCRNDQTSYYPTARQSLVCTTRTRSDLALTE